ncbi:hypothetical protein BHM03_00017616 [Ensete ventricosum]|nr:hypothetical protein BHM03_00017616 [Ensete ventricosum]
MHILMVFFCGWTEIKVENRRPSTKETHGLPWRCSPCWNHEAGRTRVLDNTARIPGRGSRMLEKMWSSVIVAWKRISLTLLDLLADDVLG